MGIQVVLRKIPDGDTLVQDASLGFNVFLEVLDLVRTSQLYAVVDVVHKGNVQ